MYRECASEFYYRRTKRNSTESIQMYLEYDLCRWNPMLHSMYIICMLITALNRKWRFSFTSIQSSLQCNVHHNKLTCYSYSSSIAILVVSIIYLISPFYFTINQKDIIVILYWGDLIRNLLPTPMHVNIIHNFILHCSDRLIWV